MAKEALAEHLARNEADWQLILSLCRVQTFHKVAFLLQNFVDETHAEAVKALSDTLSLLIRIQIFDGDLDSDTALHLGSLNCVAEYVGKDLLDATLVALDNKIFRNLAIQLDTDFFLLQLQFKNLEEAFQGLANVEAVRLCLELSVLEQSEVTDAFGLQFQKFGGTFCSFLPGFAFESAESLPRALDL